MTVAQATYGTVAEVGTISDILKDFYISGLQEQLNNEVMCLEMFEKAKVSWAGRQAIVPIHVDRNSGVAFKAESNSSGAANLPDAGHQSVARLSIEARYLYGRMQVTGQAIAAAKQGGSASFIGALDLEMEKLKEDIRNRANESCVTGGRVVGFVSEVTKRDVGTTPTLYIDGNLKKLATLHAGGSNTLKLTFITCSPDDLGGGGVRFVNDSLGTTATAKLNVTAVNAAAGTVVGTVETANLDFSKVPTGFMTAVVIDTYTATGVYDPDNEPVGILGNLFASSHFGVSRVQGATGAEKSLQAVALREDEDSNTDSRETLSLARMQNVMDAIGTLSGMDPDLILCNSSMRAEYIKLLQGNIQLDAKTAATSVDGGVTGINFNGIPIRSSRHVPQGIFIFLSTSTFKLAILEDGKFADLDGNVLSRVSSADAFEGFYKWYYNHYCHRPNANGVLAGIIGGSQTS